MEPTLERGHTDAIFATKICTEKTVSLVNSQKILGSLHTFLFNFMLRIPNLKSLSVHHIRFLNNTQFCVINEEDAKSISHCMRYINFVIETSFRTYLKENLMQITNLS